MIKFKNFLLLILLLFLGFENCYSQKDTKFFLSFSFHFPRIVMYSLDYYPNQRYFFQISVGGVPHFLSVGSSINHLSDNSFPRAVTKFGVTHFTSFGGDHLELDEMEPDSLYHEGSGLSTIDFGLGYQFIDERRTWIISGGPSYVFSQTETYVNSEAEYFIKTVDDFKYIGFFEIGAHTKKNKKRKPAM